MNIPKDLPREELLASAEDAMRRYPGATLHFKFTCPHCGERCTLQEPNTLYESGECFRCGKTEPITHGGFMLMMEYQEGA